MTKLVKTKNALPQSGILAGPGEVMKRPSLLSNRTSTINESLLAQEVVFVGFSPPSALDMDEFDDFSEPHKMTRAEFLMA